MRRVLFGGRQALERDAGVSMFSMRAVFSAIVVIATAAQAIADDDQKLLQDLSGSDRKARTLAVEELVKRELQPETLPQLFAFADNDDAGVSSAAFDVLARIAGGETQNAADVLSGLKELSKSKKPLVALRARQKVLQLQARQPLPEDQRVPDLGGGGASESVQTSINNGSRHISVKRQDLSLSIDDLNGKDITLTITRQNQKTKFQAKDSADLRKQNAEAADLYDKYVQRKPFDGVLGPGGFAHHELVFGHPGGFGRGIPRGVPLAPGLPGRNGAVEKAASEKIESCLDTLAKVQKELRVARKEDFDDEKLKQLQDNLDQLKKQLFEVQAELQ